MKRLQKLEMAIWQLRHPQRSHTFLGLLILLTVCFALLWSIHHGWLAHPNTQLIGAGPDGFKNYMTTGWHVRYDTSYVHFGGMNFPFGEHVLFTDNQPILPLACNGGTNILATFQAIRWAP
ncbi:MAG: hypothetical protein IPL65_07045 [Lewinellaceae bacterium]|nr:hypothetical protein [Lewinellaceae bacterium]